VNRPDQFFGALQRIRAQDYGVRPAFVDVQLGTPDTGALSVHKLVLEELGDLVAVAAGAGLKVQIYQQ
jgi:hypothetical protein